MRHHSQLDKAFIDEPKAKNLSSFTTFRTNLRLTPQDDIANSLLELFHGNNATRLQRVMQTMLQMGDLNIAVLRQAYE